MYLHTLRSEISQGDVFENVSLLSIAEIATSTELAVQLRVGRAILLTHDCEYDKPANVSVAIAEVRDLSELSSGNQGHIRQYRTRNTFYLEAFENHLLESYVDFRRITPLPKPALALLADNGQRIVSLTDETRLALQRQIAIFFGYGR
jgi:hypothetical protein